MSDRIEGPWLILDRDRYNNGAWKEARCGSFWLCDRELRKFVVLPEETERIRAVLHKVPQPQSYEIKSLGGIVIGIGRKKRTVFTLLSLFIRRNPKYRHITIECEVPA